MMTLFETGIGAGMLKTADEIRAELLDTIPIVTLGSFTAEIRAGNPEPNYFWDESTQTGLNAIGLKNPSLETVLQTESRALREKFSCKLAKCELSLAPTGKGTLKHMISVLNRNIGVFPIHRVEINAACPNHRSGDGVIHSVLAHDPIAVGELLEEARDCPYAISLKIAPDTTERTLLEIVKLCEKHSVVSIVSGNTQGTEAVWNGKPVLSVPRAGRSGKPLFETALKQVKTLSHIIGMRNSPIQISAMGGIFEVIDVSKMRYAGASDVRVASLFYFGGGWDAVARLSSETVAQF
jgi:dihydroorotate dehydrogenase